MRMTKFDYCLLYILIISSVFLKAFGKDEILIVITIFIFLYYILLKKSITLNTIKIPLIYFGMMIASTIIGIFLGTSMVSGLVIDGVLFLFVGIGIFTSLSFNLEKIFKFLRIFLGFGICFAIFEIIVGYNPLLPYFYVDTISGSNRICSIYVHPVIAATFFTISFWLFFYTCKNKYIKYIFMLLSMISLFKTGSRSSWISIFFCLILFVIKAFKEKPNKKQLYASFFFFIFAICFLLTPIGKDFLSDINDRFISVDQSISFLQRTKSWQYITSSFFSESNVFQLLFGYGYKGSYNKMLSTTIVISNFFTVDNTFIANLYNYGLFNIFITLILIVNVLNDYLKSNSKDNNFINIAILSILVSCFFFECNYFLNISFLLYFLVGIYIEKKERTK